ncbi:MAG: hypothetical protein AAF677_10040, partial [Pseudomonadota bacterium]
AVLAAAVLQGGDLTALTAVAHAPARPEGAEAARLSALVAPGAADALLAEAPPPVRLDVPDWLLTERADEAAFAALRHRAPLDLRANTLRAAPAAAVQALAAEGVEAVLGPLSPTCLRVVSGARRAARGPAYGDGLIEVQDAASQAAAAFADARPGMAVLDLCAGGGGKILALGAAAGGQGRFAAYDAAPRRMADLPARAARAGLGVEILDDAALDAARRGFDLVFADAPCSGSGAWRRNPDAKWRLTPAALAAMTATQDRILAQALSLVRPGGTVVFATCSFLAAEGEARLAALAHRMPALAETCATAPRLSLRPDPALGDGFFAARLTPSASLVLDGP